jgi:hypothetical protein
MANQVFANGMEVSCKAADGKSVACFPDVCFTPPQTPATPPGVPIPYPNTGLAKDTTKGSRSVKISGKEVMLKNKSHFKTSYGDEPGCAPKKGVLTSKNKGKVYFQKWSMNVKVEGENVVRMMDLTTHNHGANPGNTPPWTYLDRVAMAQGLKECDGDRDRVKTDCGVDVNDKTEAKKKVACPNNDAIKSAEKIRTQAKAAAEAQYGEGKHKKSDAYNNANASVAKEYESFASTIDNDKCHKALKCFLTPQNPSRCCKGQTPHHLIPASAIVQEGGRNKKGGESVLTSFPNYNSKKAPCICVEGPNADTATHKLAHDAWGKHLSETTSQNAALSYTNGTSIQADTITYGEALEGAKASAQEVADHCNQGCIEAQVNQAHLGKKEATEQDKSVKLRRTMEREKPQESDIIF